MKVLYISPKGKRKDQFKSDIQKEDVFFDLDSISKSIVDGINSEFEDIEIVFIVDQLADEGYFPEAELSKFDLCLCDLTTSNPNVTYISGLAKGMGKPIIYLISNESSGPLSIMYNNVLKYSKASLENEFRDELNKVLKSAKENPANFASTGSSISTKPKAFISYSHANKSYLDRLMVHLKPLSKKGLIDVWADTKIKTGDDWKNEIDKALNESNIAILLISADFMASDFIVDNELPPLLSQAEVKGTKILPVILTPCRFAREPSLSRFHAVNSPSEPPPSINEDDRETIYDKLAHDIEVALRDA